MGRKGGWFSGLNLATRHWSLGDVHPLGNVPLQGIRFATAMPAVQWVMEMLLNSEN